MREKGDVPGKPWARAVLRRRTSHGCQRVDGAWRWWREVGPQVTRRWSAQRKEQQHGDDV